MGSVQMMDKVGCIEGLCCFALIRNRHMAQMADIKFGVFTNIEIFPDLLSFLLP